MKRLFPSLLLLLCALGASPPAAAQSVPALEARTPADALLFRVDADGGLVVPGTAGTGTIPAEGAGARLMWFPGRWAFRAGRVFDEGFTLGSTYWDLANVGEGSAAFGTNTRASGAGSFAAGIGAVASGEQSFSVSGQATGISAISVGNQSRASGDYAAAFGYGAYALGFSAVTIGPSIARGNYAVAIGLQNSASGAFSVAIGKNARTNNRQGSLVFGDGCAGFSSDSVYATAHNQFVARACGGYQLYTNQGLTAGVSLAPGAGSWQTISDRNRKERFAAVDGEDLLRRLGAVPVTTWNYIAQDDAIRHIGPMAQDFHAAFGVGEDSLTITTSDIDGVALAGVQALTRRTDNLRAENEALRAELAAMRARLDALDGGGPGPVQAALPWLGGLVLLGVAGVAFRRRAPAPRT